MSRVIHFFNYLEYEDLENLQFKFNEPTKNSLSGIYSSKLKEPIHFYLPKSEILEVYQDDFAITKITYKVDTIAHPELLEFCDNLDSLCINLACVNSKKWFGKDINADILIKYLNSVYNISEIDDGITIDIDIDDMNYLDKLSDYNNNDNMNLLVTISSIEFFKQTFRIKLELNSILEGIPQDYNNQESDLEMDFNEMIEKSTTDNEITEINKENNKNIETDKVLNENAILNQQTDNAIESDKLINSNNIKDVKEEIVNQETEVILNKDNSEKINTEINKDAIELDKEILNKDNSEKINTEINKDAIQLDKEILKDTQINNTQYVETKENNTELLSQSNVINKETIEELANVNTNKVSENITSNDFNDVISKETINEIESLISIKKIEKQKYLMNAERARRASANLVTKATKLDTEISDYELKLKNMSESIVSTFN